LWSHAPVAAAFLRMLRNASRTFRAGTGPSGPQSVTCPSGPPNQAADGRRHFYWYLPDIAPFVFWRPRGMSSLTSCLHGRHNHAVDVRVHPGHTMAQRWPSNVSPPMSATQRSSSSPIVAKHLASSRRPFRIFSSVLSHRRQRPSKRVGHGPVTERGGAWCSRRSSSGGSPRGLCSTGDNPGAWDGFGRDVMGVTVGGTAGGTTVKS